MRLRTDSTYLGDVSGVPSTIQRIDQDSTHGWQLRYGTGPTEWFNDQSADRNGVKLALQSSVEALRKRIKKLQAPTGLRTTTVPWKSSNLPSGISGPVLRQPKKNTPYFCFQVDVPQPNGGTKKKAVYIGTEMTSTPEREIAAREKAIALRQEAERKVQIARTKQARAVAEDLFSE